MTDRPYAFVYMMASRKNGTLYIGVTRDLGARVAEHKAKGKPQSFTTRYNVTRLVWCEGFEQISDAIAYEKRLKKYKRAWKINLIEAVNPDWKEIDAGSGEFFE